MPDDKPPNRALEPSDVEAVRRAFLRTRDSDVLLGVDQITDDATRDVRRYVRRTLVGEAIEFLEAREDLIDLQVMNGIDPGELLDPWSRGPRRSD